MLKKYLAILLAGLMLFSAVSCANTNHPEETVAGTGAGETSSSDSAVSSGNDTEEETEGAPAVEKKNYNKTFRMIGFNEVGSWYYSEEYISGGQNVHVLNNTVYEMNTMVEDYLGVEIEYDRITDIKTGGEIFTTVQPSLMSGDDLYQLCILHPYYSYNSFISGGYAMDFYELDSIDLDRAYWNAEVMDQLSLNGHAYIGLGDICQYDLQTLYCNKELFKDAGREIPYDMVRNNTWTVDELLALTTGLFRDNGDGQRNQEDTYGFATMWDANASCFMQASDIYVVTRNEENSFELSMYGEKLIGLYDKLYRWSQDDSTYLWKFRIDGNPDEAVEFLEAQSYVTLASLGTRYLGAGFEVGMLPLPKYDVEQENYAHPNWGNNLILPTTIENPDMVGDVLEMMAYYTRNHVQQIYYNDVLQLRVSEAPDDREMVELIYNTIVFDPGIAYCDGYSSLSELVYLPTFAILNGDSSMESYYRKRAQQIERGKILEKICEMGE